MHLKEKNNIISGKLNYTTTTEDGRKIQIGNIFSLSEKGVYFDWGLESCGFGQFSFSYSEKSKKWSFGNECMGPETSYQIIRALENGIRESGDEKAIYNLNKIISLISYQSSSLAKCVLLIWNSAELEGGEVKNAKDAIDEYITDINRDGDEQENTVKFTEVLETNKVKMYSIVKESYEYNNKRGHFLGYDLSLLVDMKFNKQGLLSIRKVINVETSEESWFITQGVNQKLLKCVFQTLEKDEGHYGRIWKIWKNEVGLKGSITKIVNDLLLNYKEQQLKFNLR